jgi:GntR family transcriptional regulator
MTEDNEPLLAIQGGVSIGRQIQIQIRDHIVTGLLRSGEQLPTVRAMAVELAVNPDLVSRAYAELEQDGWIISQEGSGYFVAEVPPAETLRARHQPELERLCHELLAQAARYGYSSTDIICMIRSTNGDETS